MTTSPGRREVGRPRLFSDDAIFQATDLVLRRDGVTELTLEAIAITVGCTRQALVRRFGSKTNLLLNYLDARIAQVTAELDGLKQATDTPLSSLYSYLSEHPAAISDHAASDPRGEAWMLAFLLTESTDPAFASRVAKLNQETMQGITRVLDVAIARQELEEIDTTLNARILYNLWVGEIVDWCVAPDSDMAARWSEGLDMVIGPHRLTPNPWDPTV